MSGILMIKISQPSEISQTSNDMLLKIAYSQNKVSKVAELLNKGASKTTVIDDELIILHAANQHNYEMLKTFALFPTDSRTLQL